MRNNYVNSEPNKLSAQPYIASLSKSSAFHSTHQSKSSAISKFYIDSSNEKTTSQNPAQNFLQHSFDKLNQPLSIYENFNFPQATMISGDKTLPIRKSRLFDRSIETSNRKNRNEIKRDLSMPPISAKQLTIVENNIYSQYSVEQNHIKYSIDADLNSDFNEFDDCPSVMYDSIITTDSSTPPPVHIINTSSTSEYVNRKAIIRPLAFRPVQAVNSESSPPKPPVALKPKKSSPPPVPPHASRMAMKANLNRVQSAKSGDSSGYYSSRATGTLTGTASSTDISPSFDESVSIFDSLLTGEMYSQATEQPGAGDNFSRESEHEIANRKLSLDSEIMSERQRGKILETALTNSNCKLLDAESNILELKKRLSQKSTELNKAMESLDMVKRNFDHQTQKSIHLEKTIQSLKMISNDRNRDHEMRNQATQTVQFMNDLSTNKLLEQFEEERKIWLEEKCKVLTYQRQIESNFQQLLIKCRRLESHVLHMKSQLKDSRNRPSLSANHSEDHDKSSTNSVDSSNRSYFTNVSRIEVTEHQSSF